jgi:hypothetical protein
MQQKTLPGTQDGARGTPKKLPRVGVSERRFSKTEYSEVEVSNGEIAVCPGAHFV